MRPWLLLPATWSHKLSEYYLDFYGRIFSPNILPWKPLHWRGLEFKNRLGIAGGVDKNADFVNAFWALGAGFLELGTITPLPQRPNDGKIIDRNINEMSVWNKMGFPSQGIEYAKNNLDKIFTRHSPILINIGKNRNTALEDAPKDYLHGLLAFHANADAFVINISSPNTQGLRQIQESSALKNFLQHTLSPYRDKYTDLAKPILLKLSPDIDDDSFKEVLDICVEFNIDGWVLCNTTIAREPNSIYPAEGGMSGKPLADKSKKALRTAIAHLGNSRRDRLIISVGGIFKPEDIQERIELGADLVEVYSSLVFNGPRFFADCAKYFIKTP